MPRADRDVFLGKLLAPTCHKHPTAVDALGHFIPIMAFGLSEKENEQAD
jgi:hypothetical protein